MNEQRLNLDDAHSWLKAVNAALIVAYHHATLGQKPSTEPELIAILTSQLGQMTYRHGHAAGLRRVYGGVFKGITTSNRARAMAAKTSTKTT